MPSTDFQYEEEPTKDQLARNHLDELIDNGVSQREIARLTGVPRSTLGDFLRGTHQATEATLDRIMEGLGI